ncbi:MAG: AAA family ATPase [Lachnospiraceae bacterium]|nr:AAA family ATPase [Lachnospiraceae bacterium]
MEQIYKYPRTRHLEGSREQAGDEDLKTVKLAELQGKYLVLEEKVDGANCGISFSSDGRMYLQSRGHFLNGGCGERQFDLFKLWAGCLEGELCILPAKGSGKVVSQARERARELLRRKEPFVWNATNIVRETRQKLAELFAGYGARVHILYLEAPYGELLDRNRKRERHIPENVLENMIRKLEVPEPWEAYEVKIITGSGERGE